ncbi:LOW QUALITY PROTEIN: cellobiose phosphotransferase system YdjC-like protein [Bacillus sp. JCM 19046]|nr:LOW QUALITY PROTEIN: cellobiose phosphotransferase system YdjC-like protein [Bacillus sp. JCM 19045]GAF19489.1 LOW QUALITY PROTEIN: cellobiose phosphotransferase system YdjC-like protein [Bacillus sp. JCM 19046]
MAEIIFNADDFGLSRGVNYGIIDSHLNGVVSAATMLVNAPATKHAVELAKANPSLRVGVHLALTIGRPIRKDVLSLLNEAGAFRKQSDQRNEALINLDDVYREWYAQIELFYSYGLTPSHLDSHHHMHGWSYLRPVIERLADTYQLPWRNAFAVKQREFRSPMHLTLVFIKLAVRRCLIRLLRSITKETVEIMCHPAYIDLALKQQSSYVEKRVEETEVLTSYRLP